MKRNERYRRARNAGHAYYLWAMMSGAIIAAAILIASGGARAQEAAPFTKEQAREFAGRLYQTKTLLDGIAASSKTSEAMRIAAQMEADFLAETIRTIKARTVR